MAVPKVISFFATIIIAVLTHSYWALVIGILINHSGRTAFSYFLHPYRPRPTRDHWSEIFRFSKWLLISQGLRYISERGPDLVLGRVVGARAVGLFSVAYEIAMLPTTEMVAPINRAVFPGYSRLNAESGELRRSYLLVAGLIAILALPAGVGIAVSAPVLVPLLLGDQWLAAIPLVHMIGLAGGLLVLMANSGAVFMALGRPHLGTAVLALRASLLLVGILGGAHWAGATGVAVAYVIVLATVMPLQLALTLHVLSARISEYLGAVYRPIIGCVAMYMVVGYVVIPELHVMDLNAFLDALVVVFLGAVTFVLATLALWIVAQRPVGAETRVMNAAFRILSRVVLPLT